VEDIIDDIRRGYNLYKRPGFRKERDIETMSGPGEVASPTHSVSGSILQALAVTSSRERCCTGVVASSKGRLTGDAQRNQTRSPPSPSTHALAKSTSRHRINPSTFPSVLYPGASRQNEGINATRNWRRAIGSNKLESGQ